MKNIYDVEFVSVVDKGQTFTFEQLLSFDENQKILEKFIQEQVNDQKSDLEAKIRNELTAKMQEKLEVTQRELQVKAKEAILAKEKELQEDKARLQASLEVHENSKKQIIEEKDERIKELKDLIAKIQEESKENINAINSQVEKRIEDAVARKTEELTAKRKSAVQIGDLGEQQIMDSLKSLFPTDIIVKPEEHSGGADIDMTIMEGNKEIGSILFEVKNKIAWAKKDYTNFVEKVNKANHTYNIYVHNKVVGSRGEGDFVEIAPNLTFDNRNKIFITNFDTVISLTYSLRKVIEEFSRKIEIQESKASLADKVFEFVQSEEFKNYFTRAEERRAEAELYFEKIVDQAQKGKIELIKLKDELNEFKNRF